MSARLERSTTNRVIAGVCGGIAEYLQVDATLVRVFFVIATIFTAGIGLLGYIVLLIFMPLPGHPAPFTSAAATTPGSTDPASGGTTSPAAEDRVAAQRRREAFGVLLVALGVIFFLGEAGAFRFVRWDLAWPLILIGLGVLLLAQRVRP